MVCTVHTVSVARSQIGEDKLNSISMSIKKSGVGANFIYNFISQILTLIVPLITTPYLARILHEEGNGQISFAMSIITYFTLIANLGFSVYGQREIAKCSDNLTEKRKVFWEIVAARAITTTLSLGILLAILLTVGFGEKYTMILWMFTIQVVAVYVDIQFYYQGEENFRSIAIRTIIMKVIGLVAIFLFVKTEADTWIYALCLSVSIIASNLIMWPSALKALGVCSPKELSLWRHFKGSFIIFLPALAVTVYSVCDKTMIGLFASNPDYENGCYEQAYKLNSVALLLVTVISSVFISRNANEFSKGNTESLRNNVYFACNYVWLIGSALIVGFLVLSDNLSAWFLGEGYAEVPLLMRIMSVRFIFSGLGVVFGDQYFMVIGKERYTLIATSIAAVLNLGLNAVMIPTMGATGASIATALSEFTVTSVLAFLVIKQRHVSMKKVLLMSWKYLLSAIVMGVPLFFLNRVLPYTVWSFLLMAAVGAITYFACLFILRDVFVKSIFNRVFKRNKKDGGEGEPPAGETEESVQ